MQKDLSTPDARKLALSFAYSLVFIWLVVAIITVGISGMADGPQVNFNF